MIDCYIKTDYLEQEISASDYGFCLSERPPIVVADFKTERTSFLTREGSQYKKYALEDKRIPLNFNALEESNIKPLVREFIAILMDATEIRISDEDNMIFTVKNTTIGQINNEYEEYASFTATITSNGYEQETYIREVTFDSAKKHVSNMGTYRTWPKFDITFTSDCGYISLLSPQGQMLIGNVDEPDKVFVGESEFLVDEEMHEVNNWEEISYDISKLIVTSENAAFSHTGEFVFNDYGISLKGIEAKPHETNSNFGDSRGRTIIRKLNPDKAGEDYAEDYEFWSKFRLNDTVNNNSGAGIVLGVMDENQMPITHMAIGGGNRSGWASSFTKYKQDENGVWKPYRVGPSMSTRPRNKGDFNANFKIKKRGNQVEYSLINETTGHQDNFTVTDNDIAQRKAHYVYMALLQYDYFPLPHTSIVTMVRLRKYHPVPINDIRNVFLVGDQLSIDHQQGKITLNGFPYNETVAIGSKYWHLEPGLTEVMAQHSVWAERPLIKMTYRNNWR